MSADSEVRPASNPASGEEGPTEKEIVEQNNRELKEFNERMETTTKKDEELKKNREGLAADAGREAISSANFELAKHHVEMDFFTQMHDAIDGVDWDTETTSLGHVEAEMKSMHDGGREEVCLDNMKWAEDKFTTADWERLFKDFPEATAVSFKGCGLKEIESCKGCGAADNVEVMDVTENDLGNVNFVEDLPSLIGLCLTENKGLKKEDLEFIQKHRPNLSCLELVELERSEEDAPAEEDEEDGDDLGIKPKSIESVKQYGCESLEDLRETVFKMFPVLESLDGFTAEGFEAHAEDEEEGEYGEIDEEEMRLMMEEAANGDEDIEDEEEEGEEDGEVDDDEPPAKRLKQDEEKEE